ncbi:MAG TPA: M91 family zinc metallopeptidase, partial [Solirubrobacteraceae bacterium]|nr:M91 family zinc metallopeptidase [Solirubrobacteraceae bacterium]
RPGARRPGVLPFGVVLSAGLLLAGAAVPGDARLAPSGSDDFLMGYNNCLSHFQNDPNGDPAHIIPDLINDPNIVDVTNDPKANGTTPNIPKDSEPAPLGTGKGSGSHLKWGPHNTTPFKDPVARDPCAELYHELYHAWEIDKGTIDPRPYPGTGDATHPSIPTAEVNATRAENAYRQAQNPPLPVRPKYGPTAIPPPLIVADCDNDGDPGDTSDTPGVEC